MTHGAVLRRLLASCICLVGCRAKKSPEASASPSVERTTQEPTAIEGAGAATPSQAPSDMVKVAGGRAVTHGNRGGSVSVKPFWLDRTEVTAHAYEDCVASGICGARGRSGRAAPTPEPPQNPVNHVDWEAAAQYCWWKRKRLPDDVELLVAMAGPNGSVYPWPESEASCERIVIGWVGKRRCPWSGPVPVATTAADRSRDGAMDFVGNVSEWTRTLHGHYAVIVGHGFDERLNPSSRRETPGARLPLVRDRLSLCAERRRSLAPPEGDPPTANDVPAARALVRRVPQASVEDLVPRGLRCAVQGRLCRVRARP